MLAQPQPEPSKLAEEIGSGDRDGDWRRLGNAAFRPFGIRPCVPDGWVRKGRRGIVRSRRAKRAIPAGLTELIFCRAQSREISPRAVTKLPQFSGSDGVPAV
jgi:hypothetical protein